LKPLPAGAFFIRSLAKIAVINLDLEKMMKTKLYALAFILFAACTFSGEYHLIHTDELKALIDKNYPLLLIDSRISHRDDGIRIPNSVVLPYTSSIKEINRVIPAKDTMVVVYCNNEKCPASKYLVSRLVTQNYTHVYKYVEGLQDWVNKGYPIVRN
jgi:rhodanese-related sulfurtransferase